MLGKTKSTDSIPVLAVWLMCEAPAFSNSSTFPNYYYITNTILSCPMSFLSLPLSHMPATQLLLARLPTLRVPISLPLHYNPYSSFLAKVQCGLRVRSPCVEILVSESILVLVVITTIITNYKPSKQLEARESGSRRRILDFELYLVLSSVLTKVTQHWLTLRLSMFS